MTDRAHKLRFPRSASRERHDDAASVAPAFGMPGDPSAVEAMILERAMRRQHHHPKVSLPNQPSNQHTHRVGTYVTELGFAAQRPAHLDAASTVQYVAQLEHQMAGLEAEHARLCRVMLRHVSRNAAAELELEEAEARRDLVNAAMASTQRITLAISRDWAEVAMTLSARASLAAIALEADRPTKSLAVMMRDVELAQQSLNVLLQETRRESTSIITRASTSTDACHRAAEDLRQEIERFTRQAADDQQSSRAFLGKGFASCIEAVQSSETAISIRLQSTVQAAMGGTETAVANVANSLGAMHNEMRQLSRETQRQLTEEARETNRYLIHMHDKLWEAVSSSAAQTRAQPRQQVSFSNGDDDGNARAAPLLHVVSTTAWRHVDTIMSAFARASADKAIFASGVLTAAVKAPKRSAALSDSMIVPAVITTKVASTQTTTVPTRTALMETERVATSVREVQCDPPPTTHTTFVQTDHQHLATFSGSGNSFDLQQTYFPHQVSQSFGIVSAPTVPPSPTSSAGDSLVKLGSPSVSFSASKSGTGGLRGSGSDTGALRSPGKSSNAPLPATRTGIPFSPGDSGSNGLTFGTVARASAMPPPLMKPASQQKDSPSSLAVAAKSPQASASKPPLNAAAALQKDPPPITHTKRKSPPPPGKKGLAAAGGGGEGWDSSDTEDMDVSIDPSTDDGESSPSRATSKPPAAATTGGKAALHLASAAPANMPLIAISRESLGSSSGSTPTPSARLLDHHPSTADFGAFVLPPSGEYFSMSLTRDNDIPVVPPPLSMEGSGNAESAPQGDGAFSSPGPFAKLRKVSSFDSVSPSNSFRSPRNRTVVFLGDDGGDTSPSPRNSLTVFPSKVTVPPVPSQSPKSSGLGGVFSPRGASGSASSASPTVASPRKTGPPGLPVRAASPANNAPLGTFGKASVPTGSYPPPALPASATSPSSAPLGATPSALSAASGAPKKKGLPALGTPAPKGTVATGAAAGTTVAKKTLSSSYGDFDD